MAQINKPTDYFNTKLYTGNGSTQSITGVGFQPDFTWIKARNDAQEHNLYDVIRGATKGLQSDGTGAEYTLATSLTSFDSDGFSVGSFGGVNGNTNTHVSWNWLAGGTASSNTDGSITSSVSANTTAGFSIVNWTGSTSSSAETVGHGLGVTPKIIILKNRDSVDNWFVYHSSVTANNQYLNLNTTSAITTAGSNTWGTGMTSTLVGVRPATFCATTNDDVIMYCFAEKKGFSKFGTYTGNGSTDGPFIYTGFKPGFIMIKRYTASSIGSWLMYDTKRDVSNLTTKKLFANESGQENLSTDPSGVTASNNNIDIYSNGFKQKENFTFSNGNGDTYLYIAFAEEPLVGTNNIPATAR